MSKNEEKHAKALRPDDSHKKGCVIRCTNKGHNHREEGYAYAAENYESMYNLDFMGNPANKARLDAHLKPIGGKPTYFRNQKGWDPRYTQATWYIGGAKPSNWKLGSHPMGNQAHHILPVGALHDRFDTVECIALQSSGYNINAGVNIIILPTDANYAEVMQMLQHCGQHRPYNAAVKQILTKIKGKFSKGKSNDEDHTPVSDENIPNVKSDIDQWSRDQAASLFIAGHEVDPAKPDDRKMAAAPVFSTL